MKTVALYCKHLDLDSLSNEDIADLVIAGKVSITDKPQPEGFVLTLVACKDCLAKANAAEQMLRFKN